MKIELERYLEDLENRLDLDEEIRLRNEWLNWADHKNPTPFRPQPRRKNPSKLEWTPVCINDTLEDEDLSLYGELCGVNGRLTSGSNAILRIRANYGVGNVSTAFGAREYIMPRENNNLPTVHEIGEDGVRALLDRPTPDLTAGNFAKILRMAERFKEIQRTYPKLGEALRIEQPDLQGPVDNLELLWGSSYFYALYDDPDIIHAFLTRVTDFIDLFMERWLTLFPNTFGVASYFRHIERGGIVIRDDSAMNLSPEFFAEFIAPYDGRLLKKYHGIVHFCGRGDHFIDQLAKLDGLTGINMSQPHLNDMDKIFACTIDRGVHLSLSVPPFPVSEEHDQSNLVFLD